MPNLMETGRGQPGRPDVSIPREAEIELETHEIARENIINQLTQWWEDRLGSCREYYSGAVGYSSNEVAKFLTIPQDRLDFAIGSADIRVIFSSTPGEHPSTEIYSKGELEIFLAQLYPKITVKTLWCRSHAPVPCAIFLESPDGALIPNEQIEAANLFIEVLAGLLDCKIEEIGEPRIGSWFRDFLLRTKRRLTSEEMADLARNVRNAVEAEFLQKPAAEAEHKRLEGTALLLTAIGDNNAVVMLGRVLLVKCRNESGTADVVVRTLSEREFCFLQDRKELLCEPQRILDVLAEQRIETQEVQEVQVKELDADEATKMAPPTT